ncbi:MAG: carbon-nitrogen hydrolase family protein [Bacteriovoracaceae bacterium]|nr:carbon-nitrogen hydrolase family protein [Bacteriovoracaceae bacterium]
MKIGVIQLTSVLEPEINLKKIRTFLDDAKKQNVQAVFLPEVFYSISDGTKPTTYLIEGENEHFKNIQKLAKDYQIYLLGGSAATLVDGKIINRAYHFDPKGKLLASYDKIHLFACNLLNHPSQTVLNESAIYSPGDKLCLLPIEEFTMGTTICFDVRFPEMFRKYYKMGANLFTVSAAFTVPTGKAHWHTLLRARAIETQSYVVAAAQWGQHNAKISTFGHSLIVNPWGEVMADAGEGEKLITAELDLEQINRYRERLSVPVDTFLM